MIGYNRQEIRYEIKMECEFHQLPLIHSWTRLHSAAFSELFPPRQVNSIYFDTPDLDTYNDHIEGIPERRKLRFRWYGPNLESATGHLELKEKNDRIGWKLIQPIESNLLLCEQTWTEIQTSILEGIHKEKNKIFQEMLSVSRPIVLTCYQREYYISANQQVRMTLDYNLRSYNQWNSIKPNLIFRSLSLNKIIIELKAEKQYAKNLGDVIAQFPVRANRNSKFTSAVDSFLGY